MGGYKHYTSNSPFLEVRDGRTGKTYQIPTEDGNVVDSGELQKIEFENKPLTVYDPAFSITASTKTEIANVDGDNGILEYRGYKIQDLAPLSFETVTYLLFEGSFPNEEQLQHFKVELTAYSRVPVRIRKFIASFPTNAHPMTIFMASMAALGAEFPNLNPAVVGQSVYADEKLRKLAARRCFALSTAICGTIARHLKGLEVVNFELVENEPMSILERFFAMLIRKDRDDMTLPPPSITKIATSLAILHAEHGLNCSTAAVLHLTSSGVDVFSAISGAIGALYGPLHGGAAEQSLTMIRKIAAPENVPDFLGKVKAKQEKLMGFGHRIYRTTDPRAKIIEKLAVDAQYTLQGRDQLLETANKLRDCALADEYFVSRKLFPNVDYFSGLIYRSFNIPDNHFTMMFALARCSGWLAHWLAFQAGSAKAKRIWRPQSIYLGPHMDSLPPGVDH